MPATKTDVQALEDLRPKYKPADFGILSDPERDLIRTELELDARTGIEVQNIRNAAVMVYGQHIIRARQAMKDPEAIMLADCMSGITAVIDEELSRRGLPV